MDEDIIYLNNQCDRLNDERIKLLSSPAYQIGKKLYKIPLIKFILNNNKYKYDIDKFLLKKDDLEWHPRVAVYTAVIGNYDVIKPAPPLYPEIYSFFLFMDSDNEYENWKKKEIPEHIRNLSNPILINRYLKMHPYELFPDYDFAVYLDGNIQIISDIRPMLRQVSPATGLAIHTHSRRNCVYDESKICIRIKKGNRKKINTQMNKYRKEGFPCHWGLFECTMIICDLKNEIGERILSSWWEEFLSAESLRDQLSLPYILWKNGYKKEDIGNFFINIFKNPKLCWHNHNRSYK
jgi:hypothetical protein